MFRRPLACGRVAGRVAFRKRLRLALVVFVASYGIPAVLTNALAWTAQEVEEHAISAIPAPPQADPRRVALGEALFSDTRLSQDGNQSCSTCHNLLTNGASREVRDPTAPGSLAEFNTPTVFNAALNFRLNWEGRFRTLQEQAEALLQDAGLMGADFSDITARLRQDPALVAEFSAAYGHPPDRETILDALATFQGTLLTPDNRFDKWLRGDAAALSRQELDGYGMFRTFGCVSCHQGVAVGGNLFQRRSIFAAAPIAHPVVLRVPGLRNVAVTAPYLHDGSEPTLEGAVQYMAASQLGRTLTPDQVSSIVAFLGTLTGEYRGRGLRAE